MFGEYLFYISQQIYHAIYPFNELIMSFYGSILPISTSYIILIIFAVYFIFLIIQFELIGRIGILNVVISTYMAVQFIYFAISFVNLGEKSVRIGFFMMLYQLPVDTFLIFTGILFGVLHIVVTVFIFPYGLLQSTRSAFSQISAGDGLLDGLNNAVRHMDRMRVVTSFSLLVFGLVIVSWYFQSDIPSQRRAFQLGRKLAVADLDQAAQLIGAIDNQDIDNLLLRDGTSIIVAAIGNRDEDVIKLFERLEFDPDQQDDKGTTLLLHAVNNNHMPAVELLLARGADVHLETSPGRSVAVMCESHLANQPRNKVCQLVAETAAKESPLPQ